MKQQEKILKGLGNISRMRIMLCLKSKKSLSVGQISRVAKCSYKATSKHLAILSRVNLVDRDQKGYEMHYQLSSDMHPFARSIVNMLSE